ncbi:hypothetical protein ACERIM_06310 [Natrinema sp. H-ect1]|uniref:hypothetical protein n=1 Tax=Natrinema sp. H-ect1 TaxID=3242700 RepID=UPI00359DD7C2
MGDHSAFGRVYPERSNFRLSPREVQVDDINFTLVIHNSQIMIKCNPPEDIDPFTLRNVLLRGVRSQVDLYGFLEGRAYDVEIDGMLTPSGDQYFFEFEIPSLSVKEEDIKSEYERKIKSLFENGNAKYLQRSLHDFRLAIKDPHETGFACYRSIESIRKHFHILRDIPDDTDHRSKAWAAMHDALGTEKEDIIKIQQNFANERRHGGINPVTDEEREEIFLITHDTIFKYIDYLYERQDSS